MSSTDKWTSTLQSKFTQFVLTFIVHNSMTATGHLGVVITIALIGSSIGTSLVSSNLSVYDKVPGLPPSPYYSFRVREYGSEEWLDTFALLTECTAEKFCNTTGAFEVLNGWSNTYLNFEMKDKTDIEIRITKLVDGHVEDIEKAVVHPVNAAEECDIQGGRVIVRIRHTGLFTVDINGQMDDQDTGKLPDGSYYDGPPIHTLTIFANPFLEGKPSVEDAGVHTVEPGEEAPTEGDWHTLYFLPGIHDIGLNFTIHSVMTSNKCHYFTFLHLETI